MSIWDSTSVDWQSGDGLRAVQLFERAYADRHDIRELARTTGIEWPDSPEPPRAVHDAWIWLLVSAAEKDRLLDIAAELLNDSDRSYFHVKLQQLLGDFFGAANQRRIFRYGLPVNTEITKQLVETLPVTDLSPGSPGSTGLQSITVPGAGLPNLEQVIRVYLDARRRIAMILRGGRAAGTGFLVGDDLLLTAAHVLDMSTWPPTDVTEMEARFDFYDQRSSAEETGTTVPIVKYLTGSPPAPGELLPGQSSVWEAAADRLDFALLQLARPIGAQESADHGRRGHYRLSDVPYNFAGSPVLSVFHHPLGLVQTRSLTQGAFETNAARTRFRYLSNTDKGSSGAPLVDESGRLVGLHHYSTSAKRQAVPVDVIAKELLAGEFARFFAGDGESATVNAPRAALPVEPDAAARDPFKVLVIQQRPYVDREPLRTRVEEMTAATGKRLMVISGASESGVSASYRLLSHVASRWDATPALRELVPGGLEVVMVDLREKMSAGAKEVRRFIMDRIYVRLSGKSSEQTLAQLAKDVSTFKTRCETLLRKSDKQWWIFLDSIDAVAAVSQQGIDELLAALISISEDDQMNFRIVLAGREARQFPHPSVPWAEKDEALGLSREHTRTWLERRVDEEGKRLNQLKLAATLDVLFPHGLAAPRLAELQLALPAAVFEVSDD